MLSADDIRLRFEQGVLIDRYGFIVPDKSFWHYDGYGIVQFMHYRILDGTPLDEIRESLAKLDMMEWAIEHTIQTSLEFIKDVLKIDLEQHLKERNSTNYLCMAALRETFARIEEWREHKENSRISYNGTIFDADLKARTAINSCLLLDTINNYWVDAGNEEITPWTKDDLLGLGRAIAARSQQIHLQVTEWKKMLRACAETNNLAAIQTFTIEE